MTNQTFKDIAEKQIGDLKKIKDFTCTLFKIESPYKQHGTGVFVNIKEKYFLFTAAHVLDDIEKLFIPTQNGKILIKPGGRILKNNAKESRENDELDLGIMILDEMTKNDLINEYSFVNEKQLELNHNPIDFHCYAIFGYPSSWSNKSLSRNSFHSIPFFTFTKCATKNTYQKLNRSDELNLIVHYDRKNTPNLKSKTMSFGPDLFGISGCGLWFLNPNNLESEPKLIGIMNEWSKTNRTLLIATRIDAYTEILRNKGEITFQETNLFSFK
ncbi:hypothetical protein [Kaistella carnis]|uniref:hypothetical protein n=1 Tax=Kaistella carnis TaxID=1241979 RepID=UPI00289A2248|nr:hypothetical protein [Kaistella carnis]